MDLFLHSEGEPNYDDHRCIGQGCQICSKRKPSSRTISHPDSTSPNHHCMGPGCPICNTKRRTSTLQTRSTLHKCHTKRRAFSTSMPKCVFQSVSSYEASPLSSGSSQFSNPDMLVTGSPHSDGQPPHQCREIPCDACGKGKKL